MSAHSISYFIGFAFGAAAVSLPMWLSYNATINKCRTETGAYECVIKAVPVSLPAWVKNGETK